MTTSLFDIAPALATYLLALVAVLGACMGSFMNCLAWRLVGGQSVLSGRSYCPRCKEQLSAVDLIPIVSWVALRGRCRHCKKRIPVRYVLVEIVMAAVFVAIVFVYGFTVQALAYGVLACILCGVTLVDVDTYTIPNGFILAGIATWAFTVWFMGVPPQGFWPGSDFATQFGDGFLPVLADGVAGGLLLGGGILAFSLLFEQVTKRESLGGGDVKLLFVTGLFLGAPLGLFCLLMACFIEIIIAFVLRLSGGLPGSDVLNESDGGPGELESLKTGAIPFGPAIAVATVLTLLIGSPCMTWYVGLFM